MLLHPTFRVHDNYSIDMISCKMGSSQWLLWQGQGGAERGAAGRPQLDKKGVVSKWQLLQITDGHYSRLHIELR